MVDGDSLLVKQYADIEGITQNKVINSTTITFADLQASGDQAIIGLPFALEALQTGTIGLTLIAGTIPLDVGVRITNPGTGL